MTFWEFADKNPLVIEHVLGGFAVASMLILFGLFIMWCVKNIF